MTLFYVYLCIHTFCVIFKPLSALSTSVLQHPQDSFMFHLNRAARKWHLNMRNDFKTSHHNNSSYVNSKTFAKRKIFKGSVTDHFLQCNAATLSLCSSLFPFSSSQCLFPHVPSSSSYWLTHTHVQLALTCDWTLSRDPGSSLLLRHRFTFM